MSFTDIIPQLPANWQGTAALIFIGCGLLGRIGRGIILKGGFVNIAKHLAFGIPIPQQPTPTPTPPKP